MTDYERACHALSVHDANIQQILYDTLVFVFVPFSTSSPSIHNILPSHILLNQIKTWPPSGSASCCGWLQCRALTFLCSHPFTSHIKFRLLCLFSCTALTQSSSTPQQLGDSSAVFCHPWWSLFWISEEWPDWAVLELLSQWLLLTVITQPVLIWEQSDHCMSAKGQATYSRYSRWRAQHVLASDWSQIQSKHAPKTHCTAVVIYPWNLIWPGQAWRPKAVTSAFCSLSFSKDR